MFNFFIFIYTMKILKFQNEYYKKCETRQVSIEDDIVEIIQNRIDVPIENTLRQLLFNVSSVLLIIALLYAITRMINTLC